MRTYSATRGGESPKNVFTHFSNMTTTRVSVEEIYQHLKTILASGKVSPKEAISILSKTINLPKNKIYYAHHMAVRRGSTPILGRGSKFYSDALAKKAVADTALSDFADKRTKKVSVMTTQIVEALAKDPSMIEVLDKDKVSKALAEVRNLL